MQQLMWIISNESQINVTLFCIFLHMWLWKHKMSWMIKQKKKCVEKKYTHIFIIKNHIINLKYITTMQKQDCISP